MLRSIAWRQPWDYGALMLRVILGVVFIVHGSQKVFGAFGGPGPAGVVEFVGRLGLAQAPLWAALLMISEFGGGFLVLLGVAAELGALMIAIDMLVATLAVHLPQGFFTSEGGMEFTLVLFTIAAALFISGPGRFVLWDPFRPRERGG